MSPDTAQRIFQSADTIFEELGTIDSATQKEIERLTLKDVSTRIATQTGLAVAVVTPVLQMYVKNRSDLVLRKGRGGGIRRAKTETEVSTVTTKVARNCSNCGFDV